MRDNTLYEKLMDIILEWNGKINVTAIKDRAEFMEKNIEDSLSVCSLAEYSNALRIIDMGTGGGFPGLPLAIASPEKEFILADSIAKKLKVVDAAAAELGLANVNTLCGRAEDVGRDPRHRDSYDLCLSRAVANMSTLSEYCLPLVKPGGFFIAYKTLEAEGEIKEAERAISELGGRLLRIEADGRRGSGHCFAVVEKLIPTPAAYPRRAGIPSAKPLKEKGSK